MKQLEALTMPHSRLISIYLFTATLLLSTSGLPYNDDYRLSQNPYTWPSRAVLESQDIPARPVAPPPDPYSGNSRFSETVGRLQIYDNQGWPISGQNGYNSGYESYNYPGYQWFYNRRGLNNGYYQGYQNPAPTNPWYPVQPDNRQNNPVGQGNQNIPDFDPIIKSNPSQPNPRPNMRHVPQDDSFDDRSQDTLNSVWDQFVSSHISGPSYWEKTGDNDRRGQAPITIPPTTTAEPTEPPPRVDPNFFKPDGSVNKHRLGMIQAPVEQDDTIRDRNSASDAFSMFMSMLGRNFFKETAQRARARSEGEVAVPRPKLPTEIVEIPDPTEHPPMYDKPYVDIPKDFLDKDYIQKTEENITKEEDATDTDTSERSAKMGTEEKEEEEKEKFFTSDGKMFQSEVYSDFINAENTKLSSVNGKNAFEEERKKDGELKRTRRQTDGNEGHGCRAPESFSSCHFYPHCFQEVNQRCVSRDSFIGDDVSSICSDLHDLATSTESDVLRTFLSEVIACVDMSLLEVLESPSCDDVTDHLSDVLLTPGKESCLAKASNFCVLVETSVARYSLAKVFAEPKGREDFMLRLLVNLGTLTNMCKGPGALIFRLDLLSQVMHRNTTYTLPNGQPMPVFEP